MGRVRNQRRERQMGRAQQKWQQKRNLKRGGQKKGQKKKFRVEIDKRLVTKEEKYFQKSSSQTT